MLTRQKLSHQSHRELSSILKKMLLNIRAGPIIFLRTRECFFSKNIIAKEAVLYLILQLPIEERFKLYSILECKECCDELISSTKLS